MEWKKQKQNKQTNKKKQQKKTTTTTTTKKKTKKKKKRKKKIAMNVMIISVLSTGQWWLIAWVTIWCWKLKVWWVVADLYDRYDGDDVYIYRRIRLRSISASLTINTIVSNRTTHVPHGPRTLQRLVYTTTYTMHCITYSVYHQLDNPLYYGFCLQSTEPCSV